MNVIRCVPTGKRRQRFLRFVVSNARAPLNGKPLAVLGYCSVNRNGPRKLDVEGYSAWVRRGAQPSDRMAAEARDFLKAKKTLDLGAGGAYDPMRGVSGSEARDTDNAPRLGETGSMGRPLSREDVAGAHDARISLAVPGAADLVLDSFRTKADADRHLSLGWRHRCDAPSAWRTAMALCAAHAKGGGARVPVEWLINYEDGEESGSLGSEEVPAVTDAGARALAEAPARVTGIVVSCGRMVFEADITSSPERSPGMMIVFWPDGHMSAAALASVLGGSRRMPPADAAALAPQILALARPA